MLGAWTNGDERALARMTPIVYDELHCLARYHLKRKQAARAPRKAKGVEMREWKSAKAWLYRELAGATAHGR